MLVSSLVHDLVAGPGIDFLESREVELKGLDGAHGYCPCASSFACARSASSRVRSAFLRICARCASHSARSAFVGFFFAIVFSQESFDPFKRRGDVAHVEE